MKKNIIQILGATLGLLFSLWDSMINYADTAPINDDFGIEIISWPFFLGKTFLYIILGSILGFLIKHIIKLVIIKKKSSKDKL